ncbi:hypothetical protein F5Y01DRAFT_283174 [Xylaria sp. FL0043]|nr:hypothetical protein F5Y01DRAFT_283174 [Xylaria sp. FL0043]
MFRPFMYICCALHFAHGNRCNYLGESLDHHENAVTPNEELPADPPRIRLCFSRHVSRSAYEMVYGNKSREPLICIVNNKRIISLARFFSQGRRGNGTEIVSIWVWISTEPCLRHSRACIAVVLGAHLAAGEPRAS